MGFGYWLLKYLISLIHIWKKVFILSIMFEFVFVFFKKDLIKWFYLTIMELRNSQRLLTLMEKEKRNR